MGFCDSCCSVLGVRLALLLPLLLSTLAPLASCSASQTTVVEGLVKLDVVRIKSSAVKVVIDGGAQTAFVRSNGYFSMRLAPGPHLVQVSAVGAMFPQVKLDVSSKHLGSFKATFLQEGNVLVSMADQLVIGPSAPEVYYEARQPFNVWSLLMSPMGIMVAVMVFGVFVMPYLMENIDPEEMKQMQEQMRSQPAPSLSGLLGAGR